MPSLRTTLFRLIPTAAVVGLLIAVEFGLRAWKPELRQSLVEPVTIAGTDWLRVNRSFLTRYFPSRVAILPELKTTLFRKTKLPNTFRVVCLGESSMFGTPYQMAATIPAITRRQLRHLYPDREIEVISLAASAINSNVLRDLAERMLDWDPDLVLIYTGHNEFYGPEGVGAGSLERWLPGIIPWKYDAFDLALFSGMSSLLRAEIPPGTEQNLMQQVSQGVTVAAGSDDEKWVYAQFRRNMDAVLETLRDRKIPCIVSDVTSNLEFPPFVSDPWPASVPSPGALDSLGSFGRTSKVHDALRSIAELHATNAGVLYRVGMAMERAGWPDEAVAVLRQARDHDQLRFRAPGAINAILKDVADRHGALFVSADSLIESRAFPSLPGRRYFWEHLHLTLEGYAQIADQFVRTIVENHLLPGSGPPSDSLLAHDPAALAVPWLDLAYADLSMATLTTRWPFHDYPATSVVMAGADPASGSIAREVYGRHLGWDDACYRLAAASARRGDLTTALTYYNALTEDFPGNYYAHYLRAGLLRDAGRIPEAIASYETSVRWRDDYAPSHAELALILVNAGRWDDAGRHFARAAALSAGGGNRGLSATIAYGQAGLAANRGDLRAALAYCDSSLQWVPSYPSALELQRRIRSVLK